MKHKSAIEQMYFKERGNSETIPMNKEYFRLTSIFDKCEEKFLERLNINEELNKLYKETIDALMNVNCEECNNYFYEGFRFGVLLGLDIAKENDK